MERDVEIRDNKIEFLKNELEELKKEKESIYHKLAGFGNASKDLDSLLGNQRSVKDKMGLGLNEYTAVPPPPAQVYSPPKNDMSWTGLPEFTMAYNDKYKKVLDEIWKDKVELDGMIAKEEEKEIIKVKGEALKEKDDPRAFILPIRFEGKINKNVLADTGSDVLRTVESDSDDEEEYEIKRNKFGAPMYGPKPITYLNCNDPAEQSLALQ
ncbi:hypothetical protein Tco_1347708, partial [Tanacetum coccineum]